MLCWLANWCWWAPRVCGERLPRLLAEDAAERSPDAWRVVRPLPRTVIEDDADAERNCGCALPPGGCRACLCGATSTVSETARANAVAGGMASPCGGERELHTDASLWSSAEECAESTPESERGIVCALSRRGMSSDESMCVGSRCDRSP